MSDSGTDCAKADSQAALPDCEVELGKHPRACQPPTSTPCAAAGAAVADTASRASVARAFVIARIVHQEVVNAAPGKLSRPDRPLSGVALSTANLPSKLGIETRLR